MEERTEIGRRKFPDMVIGIGGAGKRIVKELLRREWFVKSVIKEFEQSRNVGEYRGTTVRIMDSDRGDVSRDMREIRQIREFINEIGKGISGNRNYAEEVFGLDSSCHVDISAKPEQLLDPDFEKKVKENKKIGVKVWWIDDEKYGIKNFAPIIDRDFESATFVNGVSRRRFLSKALMYHYLVEKSEYENPLVITGPGRYIAIIVSLGGGTGSGTVFDVAKFLKGAMPNSSIVLFAILPTYREPENELINAYAALSELEKFGDLFDLIILLPIDHSEYEGGDVRDSSYWALREFSENFPYIFIATYDRFFQNDPHMGVSFIHHHPYRKFVVASGYIVRYAAGYSMEKGIKVRKAAESLINYCRKEKELRENIGNLLRDVGIKAEQEGQKDFEDRLKEFRKVFYDGEYAEILKSADYKVIEKFKENVDKAQREGVEKLKIGAKETKLDPSLSGDEKALLDAAETWLNNIEMFKDQISSAESEIFDLTLRDAFKRMVKHIPFSGELSVDLEKKEKELSSEMSRISNEIEELKEKISVLEKIKEIKEFLERCRSKKEELSKRGERKNEEEWNEEVEISDFQRKLEDWGVARDLLRELENASEYYRLQASKAYYDNRSKQWWRIFIEGRRNRKLAKKAEERIEEKSNFRILEVNLEKRKLEVLDSIFDYIPKARDISVSIEDVEKLEDLRNQIREKEDEKEIAKKRQKVIRGLWDLSDLSNEVNELRNEYEDGFREIQEMKKVIEEGKYVHNVNPEDLRVIRNISESSDLRILSNLGSTDLDIVRERVTNKFTEYVTPRNIQDSAFISQKGILAAELDGKRREVGIDAIKIITFSLNGDFNPEINRRMLSDLYGVRERDVSSHQIAMADKWDIAVVIMSMFIPIEMLRNADRYFEAYNSLKEREEEKGLLRHHSAGLEEGVFYRRDKLLDNSEVIKMKELSDEKVRRELEKIYKKVELKEVIKGGAG